MRRHLVVSGLLSIAAAALVGIGCGTGEQSAPASGSTATPAAATTRQSHQDWPTGHYKVVEGWPKPLPDTRHSHAGWTWGSFGGVYAENPDRIWIAMRGELPLPKDAAPWTPYAALTPPPKAPSGGRAGCRAPPRATAPSRLASAPGRLRRWRRAQRDRAGTETRRTTSRGRTTQTQTEFARCWPGLRDGHGCARRPGRCR